MFCLHTHTATSTCSSRKVPWPWCFRPSPSLVLGVCPCQSTFPLEPPMASIFSPSLFSTSLLVPRRECDPD